MFEVQVLIPTFSNSGENFSVAHHSAFENALLAAFGGFTLYPSHAAGSWMSNGVRFDDSLRMYGVALSSLGLGGKLAETVAFARSHYEQEAIFIRYLGMTEIL